MPGTRKRRRHEAAQSSPEGPLRPRSRATAIRWRVPLQDQIEAGERPELLVRTPTEGMAEVFYGLGEALTGEGGVSAGAIYLQFALYLSPAARSPWPRSPTPTRPTKRYEAPSPPTTASPKGTPLQIEHRHPQGLRPQPARARRTKPRSCSTRRADNPSDIQPARRAGQHHARPQALTARPSTTTRVPSR